MSETDLAEVWARSLDELAGMQIEPAHRAWLQLTRPLGLVENTALIATPNEFVKEQLETRLRALITNTLSRELGRNIQLAVTVDPTAATADPGHRPAGLLGLADRRDEPDLDSAADAVTGPLQRIVDGQPPTTAEFRPSASQFGPGNGEYSDDRRAGLLGPGGPGGPGGNGPRGLGRDDDISAA
jgi:chromosomal replication initiator protein